MRTKVEIQTPQYKSQIRQAKYDFDIKNKIGVPNNFNKK